MNDNTQAILKQIGDEFGRDNLIFARIAQIITAYGGERCKWCGSDNIRLYCMDCENVQPREGE